MLEAGKQEVGQALKVDKQEVGQALKVDKQVAGQVLKVTEACNLERHPFPNLTEQAVKSQALPCPSPYPSLDQEPRNQELPCPFPSLDQVAKNQALLKVQ